MPKELRLACYLALSMSAAGCVLLSTDPAPVVPQRPTVSSDTGTTAEGTFELEAGAVGDPGDRFDMPMTLKWGATESTELFAGGSAYSHVIVDGRDPQGIGDLLLGVRHRFVEEEEGHPSVALQWTTKLPTAPLDLGSGEIDFGAAAIATKAVGDVALTGFYELGIIGESGQRDTDLRHTLAGAASMPFARDWFSFAELAGILQTEADTEQVLLTTGVGYLVRDSLAVDCGLVVGLSEESPDLQFVVGFTHNWGAVLR